MLKYSYYSIEYLNNKQNIISVFRNLNNNTFYNNIICIIMIRHQSRSSFVIRHPVLNNNIQYFDIESIQGQSEICLTLICAFLLFL